MSKYIRYAFSVGPTSRGAVSLGDPIERVSQKSGSWVFATQTEATQSISAIAER